MADQQDYAVIVTAKEKAELKPLERDSRPLAPDEVAGHTIASLISAGTELAAIYTSEDGFQRPPGYSAVFEIEAVGSDVKDIEIGQRVFAMGNHRSYQRMKRDLVLPLPAGLKPEVASFARMMGVSMSTLTTTTARPPGLVVVAGLGVVGNLAAQNFARCGYEVIACEPIEQRRNIAKNCGIDRVLPAIPKDDPEITGKVDLVLDCSGHEQAALDGCNVIRKRGEVVLIATPWKRYTEMYAHTILHAIFHKYAIVRTGWEWEVPRFPTEFRTNSIYGNFAAALKWLAEGSVRVNGLATKISPHRAQEAYQNLLHKRSEGLTHIFDWSDL